MRRLSTGTLRKWKRDALETAWSCDTRETISHAEIKLLARRLTELIDLRLVEVSAVKSAVIRTVLDHTKEEG